MLRYDFVIFSFSSVEKTVEEKIKKRRVKQSDRFICTFLAGNINRRRFRINISLILNSFGEIWCFRVLGAFFVLTS